MIVPYKELLVNRGADFRTTIYVTNPLTGNVVNISGNTVTSKFRTSYYTANATGTITCNISNAVNGEITLTLLSPNTTVYVHPGRYVYDVNMTYANNVTRILEGVVIIKPGVTY